MNAKPIAEWAGSDFIQEAMRLNGTARKETEDSSDETVCLAVLLVALREGPAVSRIARVLKGTGRARLEWFCGNYKRGGVFVGKKIALDRNKQGEVDGHSLILAGCVGLGYLERA